MNLTEEQLRDRGILRSVEEMVAEAEKMVALSVSSMPVGRRVADPGKELTRAEVEVLGRGGIDVSRPSDGPGETGAQMVRTVTRYAGLLAASLTAGEAAALLGVSESRVRQKIGDRTLYAIRDGSRWRLPRFQFADGGQISSVGEVLREVPTDAHPVSITNWFSAPNSDLYIDEKESPVSPRDWLLSGGSAEALVPLAREL